MTANTGERDQLICANQECKKVYTPQTHNQKYCCAECCRVATNARIKQKYHENKARLRGKNRKCDSCGSQLSRYNRGDTCSLCQSREEEKIRATVLEHLGVG